VSDPESFDLVIPRYMESRHNGNALAAIGDRPANPRAHKKAFIRAVLDFGPVQSAIDLGKSSATYRRVLNSWLPAWLRYRGVYSSFEEAVDNAPKSLRVGCDYDDVAQTFERQGFLQSDYPAVFWLREALKDGASVFDLGGSVGISFYNWERYVSYPEGIRWTVCELPAAVRIGEQLARERQESRLRFTTRVEEADGYHCLLASGSLQYIDASLADSLARLGSQPKHLLINRLPLHGQRECVTLQNIRWLASPYRVFHRDTFVQGLKSLGYEVVDSWTVPDHDCWIPFYPEFSVDSFSGLYLRKST